MNSLSISLIHLESTFFREITMNSLWNHYETTMKSLCIHYIFFVISIWIHYLRRDFYLNSFFFFEFTICSPWTTMISPWNHYEITRNSSSFSRIHYLFRECPMDSPSASRFLFEFILFFRIHYLFCEFTLNPRSFSLWPHHEITVNSLFVSKIHLEFIFFAKSLRTHNLLRILSLNSLYFS